MGAEATQVEIAQLQRQLAEARQELSRVTMRLQSETRLRRDAEAAVQRTLRDLDEVVTAAGHDLGTPLTCIIGFADLYLDQLRDRVTPELLEVLGTIKDQSDKSLAMLRALVKYARTECLPRPSSPVDSTRVLEEVVLKLRSLLEKRGLEICSRNLPSVHLPEEYLRKVFGILITNVIRHSGPNRAPVVVGGRHNGAYVQLFVQDHGVGLPETMSTDVFRIFPHQVIAGQGKGTGTGLATLRKIADYYDGRTWVEKTAGGGCTFWAEFGEPGHSSTSSAT